MAAWNSSSVSFTSRMKSCRCRTRADMISRNLASGARCNSDRTAVVTSFSLAMIMAQTPARDMLYHPGRPRSQTIAGTSLIANSSTVKCPRAQGRVSAAVCALVRRQAGHRQSSVAARAGRGSRNGSAAAPQAPPSLQAKAAPQPAPTSLRGVGCWRRGSMTRWSASDSAVPEIVVSLDVHGQEGVVVRPGLVFRQLDVLLRVGIGLALAHRLLHCGGQI